ncbi:hypothetical protein ACROYT_G024862 [Oculina patagonica]
MERMLNELKTEVNLKYNMTDNYFESFARRAAAAVSEGEELDWTYLNSLGFVFAAVTTIGFGNITPKTQLGRGITVISCLVGIPITMLAFKTAGQLLEAFIRYIVVKTETVVLKRAEPKHVKEKKLAVSSTLMVFLLVTGSAYTMFFENWSFPEGFYAWFITFTTIGFGDYVQLESLQKKVDRGEAESYRLIFNLIIFLLPYVIGLSLVSCILSCIVDSMDEIRDFRDHYLNCCPNLLSLMRRAF